MSTIESKSILPSDDTQFVDPETIKFKGDYLGDTNERHNPRTTKSIGFSVGELQKLYDAIKKDGLLQSLLLDRTNNVYTLIAGERRLRTIQRLIKEDRLALAKIEAGEKGIERVMVYDRRTKSYKPAIDVYKKIGVEAKISENTSPKDFIRLAIWENTLHSNLTDYELLLQVKQMKEHGMSRKEQAETLQTNESWISQSHSLLDPETVSPKILVMLEKQKMTRSAAITFIGMPLDQQEKAAAIVQTLAESKKEEKRALLTGELADLQVKEEQAKNKIKLGELMNDGFRTKAANKILKRVAPRIESAKKKLEQLEEDGGQITVEDVLKASKDAVGKEATANKPHTVKAIRNFYKEIEKSLEEAKNNPRVVVNDKSYSVEKVRLVADVLKCVLDRSFVDHPINCLD